MLEIDDTLDDKTALCILEYYAFDAGQECTDRARWTYRALALNGFRVWQMADAEEE